MDHKNEIFQFLPLMLSRSIAGYKVQIVDDHQMLRVGVKVSMELSNVALQWIESTHLQEALNTYRRHDDIDLVLLDLNLPDSKGLQSLQTFLHEFPQARLAIFSATEDPFVVRQALAMGALGLIPKSADAETTVRLIEALLTRDPTRRKCESVTGTVSPAATVASLASVAPPIAPVAATPYARFLGGPSAKETLNAAEDTFLAKRTAALTASSKLKNQTPVLNKSIKDNLNSRTDDTAEQARLEKLGRG